MKKLVVVILLAALLAGCSSFKLGGMAYCPAGEECEFKKGK